MAPFGRALDDSSADFLPHLRAVGGLSDTDWHHILKEVPEALHFLEPEHHGDAQDDRREQEINDCRVPRGHCPAGP